MPIITISIKVLIIIILLLLISWAVWSSGYKFGYTLGYLQGMTDTLKIETR